MAGPLAKMRNCVLKDALERMVYGKKEAEEDIR